jgi:thioesterase domain-containing protein
MGSKHYLYLVPGFFGFANLGELKYFGHVRSFLADRCQRLGLEAHIEVMKTYPTSSLPKRASRVVETIARSTGRCAPVHLIGHSSSTH